VPIISLSADGWRRVALAGWLTALVFGISWFTLRTGSFDDRLLGVWQSDAERTIEGMPPPVPGEKDLRPLFGRLKVTWTRSTCTTELDGVTEVTDYRILGRDDHSVVIREFERAPSPLKEFMDFSDFTIIQFEGRDAYWVTTKVGGIREYFKRVSR
jgi:hypothetical protein